MAEEKKKKVIGIVSAFRAAFLQKADLMLERDEVFAGRGSLLFNDRIEVRWIHEINGIRGLRPAEVYIIRDASILEDFTQILAYARGLTHAEGTHVIYD